MRHTLALFPALLTATLAAPLARADQGASLQVAELRRGAHLGVGIGPIVTTLLTTPEPKFGVATRFFAHLGLSRWIELRAGLQADAAGSQVSYMGLGLPVSLRFNFNSTYSIMVGASAGMMTDTTNVAFVAGPEWSILSFRFGARRQFEIELAQGFQFHLAPRGDTPNLGRFQNSLVLTYLNLGAPP